MIAALLILAGTLLILAALGVDPGLVRIIAGINILFAGVAAGLGLSNASDLVRRILNGRNDDS